MRPIPLDRKPSPRRPPPPPGGVPAAAQPSTVVSNGAKVLHMLAPIPLGRSAPGADFLPTRPLAAPGEAGLSLARQRHLCTLLGGKLSLLTPLFVFTKVTHNPTAAQAKPPEA